MAYDAFAADAKIYGSVSSVQTQVNTSAAQWLAYMAAAPLMIAALVIVADENMAMACAYFMSLYGAALLVFFGGVRWGVAIMRPEGPTMRALLGASLPMLAALPLFAPSAQILWKFPVIMALTALLLVDDLYATRRGSGAPAWYLSIRLPLTVLIEMAFLVALVGM
jgi:Protein of unknown function (DUF3429)